jgi:hypothetical protein
MVKPGIFIVDDVALPTPITFLVLLGEKAVAAKLAGGGLGLASGGPRVGRLSETGSDNDDREGQSGDEHLHDTSSSIVRRCRRRRSRKVDQAKGGLFPVPEVKKEQNVTTTTRVVGVKRPRSRVVVMPRSLLNAGTKMLPGERKFLDYAFPPTHVALDVVSNTGGRVGWHNSPLPGPFFPQ